LGLVPAILVLAFYTLEPNLGAHARLVTTDLGVTCFFFATIYFLWRSVRRPGLGNLAASQASGDLPDVGIPLDARCRIGAGKRSARRGAQIGVHGFLSLREQLQEGNAAIIRVRLPLQEFLFL